MRAINQEFADISLWCTGVSKIIGVEWYDGVEGFAEPNCPVLAICLDNGRMQLMRWVERGRFRAC